MPELSKGANIAMGPGPVVAELHAVGGTVDLSALLVAADGKVRSDDDLVFYNQPSAESDAVRHVAADAAGGERIEVDPAALHIEAYSARMTERRPVLHTDGTIEMNAGPVEFKRR
ncbi:TerD family protein [Streptomyces sp. bgisy034]|uniref:TerD family protein n=1 Tax=Streptomyces sp. bgisy034 TaxID=3413774 RepID=UPI003EB85783